ncbi:MAG: single-stranded-DNA-specific exonuclease RecJ [Pseudodesulfovibrio sp.]|uniref:Single-stranded-DNA-specific exonuclease RecJ n=1 Tax=Pseudodesulfovibrio aespoeensis (strain ATCC 700646 / DSM 10631 / Aspo-2) TaxID=643562 RepID=E6VTM7_PSEA9|nr:MULTISPECIES: single-stranded-DNA-specific exonuclease RecJ [Pseudodesulfovibrio]MBU4191991.1 single-stranded-DNA-specific exonuclease RecJ [Pseudomonadota bacterium]ADU63314.1 single-stranded-DNA-specific exonuclease RecJ [Pseudodesulfovibrio aespoeensis Aspo-2]MBU4244452.1 single-stranded-DNA-specific exonuclease RecJ [Pseudomonadota bacterium]MBU4377763.1 single-stranded-DNA-specific exonuclease RecJ [Pseudomonadota bacterium]MBU4474948.1 single-stranded-DNA-specific exonuclease RecJ [Ps
MPCIWKARGENAPPSSAVMAEQLSVSPLIVDILWNRGLTSVEDMDRFLSPGLRHLAKPSEIPGLMEAAEVLARGLAEGRTLAIWGDYDVDGITATALIKEFLALRGISAMHHLPNRMEEGYGMNIPGVEQLAQAGAQMLLTVDCGISDIGPVARARELGMLVAVTDHHLPGDALPDAHAVCNPRLREGGPCDDLAGVGVAFMLVCALNRMLPGEQADVRPLLDLVALGTVADVVRLTGQNRILVKNGLLVIKEAARPGMAALKVVSDYERKAELGAGQIGFNLAPRVNAAGRMGDPGKALSLLLAKSFDEAMPIAEELNAINMERRRQEQEIADEAFAQAETMKRMAGLVLHADHWHPGIIGIVASRVVERYYRPTLMLCSRQDTGLIKGSGRSISEFDLHESLKAVSPLLAGFGGHKQAAGLSLVPENLAALREQFNAFVISQLGPEPLTPTLKLDRQLPFAEITNTLLNELELLQPFGLGNPEPVFASAPVTVAEYRLFGRENEHVKLVLADAQTGARLPGKAWRMGREFPRNTQGQAMRFAFTPKIDRFRGIPSIDLRIRDWLV